MIFRPTPLRGSFEIEPRPFTDHRGWFARFYSKDTFAEIGHTGEWVQMNHSFTVGKGAVRGLHFQRAPKREIKLVRCIAGAVFDVIVDLREGSPTFLQWHGAVLSAKNRTMMYVPEGFAHGFQTLEENCELIYLHSEFYSPGYEGGLRYDDPALRISWPLEAADLSERDRKHVLIDPNFAPL